MIAEKEQNLLIFSITIIIILADRLTKLLSSRFNFCNWLFCSKQAINKGAAFGLFQGYNWLFIIVGITVLFLILYFYKKTSSAGLKLAFALIFGGTLSNLLDRVIYGYIPDWLAFGFIQFPSFNLADAANCIGVLILIISLIKKR